MSLRPSTLLIAALLPGFAMAQGFQQQVPQQGFQPPPQARPQEPPCFKEFSALRDEAQGKAKLVLAANKRKAPPQEACKLLNGLIASENKLVKYVEANSTWCGIPQEVVTNMKKQHAGTSQVRDRICEFASRPAAPAGPSLSDALGTSRLPDSSNISGGRGGTFDTMTGTPPRR
jgi:hypothetical protein